MSIMGLRGNVFSLSSTTLLAFVFFYSVIYLVNVHRFLPDDKLPADPYEVLGTGAKNPSHLPPAAWSRATNAGLTDEMTSILGFSLAAGQAAPEAHPLTYGGETFTVAGWFRPKRHHVAPQCIASFGGMWALALLPDGCLAFTIHTANTTQQYVSAITSAISQWTHVAISYKSGEPSQIYMYINGTLSPSSVYRQEHTAKGPGIGLLQLAACTAFNVSYGGQWIGRLAGLTLLEKLVSYQEVMELQATGQATGTLFSLSTNYVPVANSTLVPSRAKHPDILEQFREAHSCAMPSPNEVKFVGVPKPSSLTAMAWIQLADAPRQKEACILSHGSWEKGWKLSLTPHMNLQFTVRTAAGHVHDYFSKRMESHGDWQHVAVAYKELDASAQFYINGFPVEMDTVPQVAKGKHHPLSSQDAPLTVGRCQADHDTDEKFMGSIADVVLWNQALDFLALRMVLHRGVAGARSLLAQVDPSVEVVFATPATGCHFRLVSTPTFAAGWKPTPKASSTKMLQQLQHLLGSITIMTTPTETPQTAARALQFIDAELSLILKTSTLQLSAIILASHNDTKLKPMSMRHLNISLQHIRKHSIGSTGYLQHIAEAAARSEAKWVLIVSGSLNPMEYWLWNILTEVLEGGPSINAVKSLTLNHAGNIKSAGLRHRLTVVGDGHVYSLPYMLYRGYPVNYLADVVNTLSTKVEAASCESLLVDKNELLAAASKISPDMEFLFQCSAMTSALMNERRMAMAWGSWILDQSQPEEEWNSNTDSMLRFFETNQNSARLYNDVVARQAQQAMMNELQTNLTVKWMFACGGSWAWEAANMVEHLDRKVQLRVQIQKPFQYCEGHNVLGTAAPSFAEQVERMIHLPSLRLGTESLAETFQQDDVVVLHRDYFRVTNWVNPSIKRPKYLIGRYMNEVTSLHARLVEQCNALDEVWVPSKHHVDLFARAGVQKSKLVVMPESLDTNFFNPNKVQPLPLPGRKSFVFLSNFKFEERKNWKALIWAFCDAFSNTDDVSLYIHTNLRGKFDKMDIIMETIHSFIDLAIVGQTMHRDNSTIPHIALTGRPLTTGDMMSLYKASDAFVLPTHGEGWGLPLHEAMAMELPTISTGWGGNTQFMTQRNSYLIQVREFEPSDAYDDWLRNMKWAKPDERHLSKLMREVFDNPNKAKAKGMLARQDVVSLYSNQAVANRILERLSIIEQRLAKPIVPPTPEFGFQFQWTLASDVKVCTSMKSSKRAKLQQRGHGTAHTELSSKSHRRTLQNSSKNQHTLSNTFCSSKRNLKLAFVTPFPPRHDGLSDYALQLRSALSSHCGNLQIDVFAIVLDFWNVESEVYDADTVKMKICRESYSDYEAAAALVNKEYDGVLLNFKLGALGGTQCAFATCFAKLLIKPLITIVHSLSHNVDDALQATLVHTLSESDAAVVFSERARFELDTAIGYLPADSNMLQANSIHVVPHGADSLPAFPNKDEKKGLLGLKGKTVLLTLGYQGPDKGIDHALRGIALLPDSLKDGLIYLVVGQPADCGQQCVDHHSNVEQLASELRLRNQVLIINEHLSQDAFETVLQAADIFLAVYPDDLFPYPATFYDALARGCAMLATPFKAALSHMPGDAGSLVWDRSPESISRHLQSMLQTPNHLSRMQLSAWHASRNLSWEHAAQTMLHNVILPVVN